MMRVLHVIGPMTVGGAQTQLLGLVRAAHGRRWDATVCATAPGPMVDEFQAAGLPVVVLRRRASPGVGRLLRLRRLVSDGGFDVLHANLWQSNAYARLAVVGRRRRPGVVISERNVEAHRSALQRTVDRLLARVTDVWVGNTTAVCDFIGDVHPVRGRPVVLVPNAVDTAVFRPGPRPAGDVLRIGSVGRLFPEKGFDVLTDAVQLLVEQGVACSAAVAGVGPLREALVARATGLPISFIGPLEPGEPVAEFLRSLHVFVLPSTHREGRPNAVLEALACGVPSVVTDVAGMRETVDGDAAIVPPGDAAALARAIRSCDDDARPRTSRRPPRSFEDLAADYAGLFEAVVARVELPPRTVQ